MSWTEERLNQLRHLIEIKNYSGSMAANELGVSRSSAISAAARHGIRFKFNRTNQYSEKYGIVKEKRTKLVFSKDQVMIAESYVPPLEQRKSLMELRANSCRWPLGDGPVYFFCGGEVLDGRAYCSSHCAIAYTRTRETYDPKRKRDGNSI